MADRGQPTTRWAAATVPAVVCLCGLLALALLTTLTLVWSAQALRDAAAARVSESSAASAAFVQTRLDGVAGYAEAVATRPSVPKALTAGGPTATAQLQPVMPEVKAGDPTLAIASVLNPAGRVVATTAGPKIVGMDLSYRDYYQGSVRTGRTYISESYESVLPSKPLLVNVTAPVRDGPAGRVLGYVTLARSLEVTQGFVRSFSAVAGVDLLVTDQRGATVAAPEGGDLGRVDPAGGPWLAQALHGESGVTTVQTPSGPFLLSYRPLTSGWMVAAELPESTLLAPLEPLRTAVLVLAAGLAALIVAGGVGLWRRGRAGLHAVGELDAAHAELVAVNAGLEGRVEERTRELEAANEELEGFVYSVSHDLRAPLRALDGFSQALDEDCGSRLDAHDRHYLERIRCGAKTMGRLIDDLLRLSRLSRAPLAPERVDVTALARRVAASVAAASATAAPQFVVADGLVADADEGLLAVALENLIGNAVKFSREAAHPTVEVGGAATAGETVIFVRDNGVGFDMAYADMLFRPFQRLHRSDQFEGTGIGLATVERIARRHGGRIWADSTPGRGATFHLALPTRGKASP